MIIINTIVQHIHVDAILKTHKLNEDSALALRLVGKIHLMLATLH